MTPLPHLLLALAAPLGPASIDPIAPAEAFVGPLPELELELEGDDLTSLSLEELMNMEVTIGSRTGDPLNSIPAAVYVLTGDEIRRSGHTSLQEALRMVPGFAVSRYGTSGWAVSARGFSGGFSNQLLVMIDGVTVYTPLFAGVWWQLQDINMADIDRVEIIRGPGATLWGANAVNGIVNVITKHSADTVGPSLFASYGDDVRTSTLRYGDTFDSGAYRVWVKGSKWDAMPDSSGDEWPDDWEIFSAGFRTDFERSNGDQVHVYGKAWSASIGEEYFVALPAAPFITFVEDDTPKFGGLLSTSWVREHGPGDSTKVQAWIQRDHQKQVDWFSTIDSFDLDWQRTKQLSDTTRLVYGLGYRLVSSDLEGDFTLTADPETRNTQTFRGYVQEQLQVPSIDTTFTLGASVEHNDFTGLEFQPNARAFWQASENQSVWLSVARAVRTPSLEDEDVTLQIPVAANTFVEFGPGMDLAAEEMYAYELGYRYKHGENVSFDAAAFYNDYDGLMTIEDGVPYVSGANLFFPLFLDNLASAEAYGLEVAVDWDITDDWRVRSAYTLYRLHSRPDPSSTDIFFSVTDDSSPRNQANLRSYYDLSEKWELDAGFYYVDNVRYFGTPQYTRVDLRLGYQPSPDWRFSIGAQNLTEKQHPEEGDDLTGFGSEVRRNVYFSLAWSR